jgi:hypothetical protein
VLTAAGIGLALPTASIAITSGVQASDQGLAGALFTTSQQTGAAIGLAVLATAAAGPARRVEAPQGLTGRSRAPTGARRVGTPGGVHTPADAGAVSRLMPKGRRKRET